MPIKLKNLYPGKLPLPQLNIDTYDPQTIHYHQMQEDRLVKLLYLLPYWYPGDISPVLCSDLPNLDAWVELFRKSIPTYQKLAAKDPSAKDRKSAEVSSQTLQPPCFHSLQRLACINPYVAPAGSSTALCRPLRWIDAAVGQGPSCKFARIWIRALVYFPYSSPQVRR